MLLIQRLWVECRLRAVSIFLRDSRTGERRARMKTTPLEKSETRREERGDFHVVVKVQGLPESRGRSKVTKPIFSNSAKRELSWVDLNLWMEWNIKWSWCELRKYKFWWRDLHWILAWENSRHLVTLPLVSRPSYLNLYFRSSRHFHLRNIFARFLMSVNESFFDTTAYGFVSPHLLSFQWSVRSYQNVAYVQTPPSEKGPSPSFSEERGFCTQIIQNALLLCTFHVPYLP